MKVLSLLLLLFGVFGILAKAQGRRASLDGDDLWLRRHQVLDLFKEFMKTNQLRSTLATFGLVNRHKIDHNVRDNLREFILYLQNNESMDSRVREEKTQALRAFFADKEHLSANIEQMQEAISELKSVCKSDPSRVQLAEEFWFFSFFFDGLKKYLSFYSNVERHNGKAKTALLLLCRKDAAAVQGMLSDVSGRLQPGERDHIGALVNNEWSWQGYENDVREMGSLMLADAAVLRFVHRAKALTVEDGHDFLGDSHNDRQTVIQRNLFWLWEKLQDMNANFRAFVTVGSLKDSGLLSGFTTSILRDRWPHRGTYASSFCSEWPSFSIIEFSRSFASSHWYDLRCSDWNECNQCFANQCDRQLDTC